MVSHCIAAGTLLLASLAAPAPASPAALQKGVFLVATDQIQEGNFHRTVVLLLTYGSGGAVGVIVNRPSRLPVSRLLPDLKPSLREDLVVWQGGPVDPGRMLYLVRSEDDLKGAARAFGDVHVSHDRDLLERILRKKKFRGRYRIIAGYAGWAPGQLEGEIQRGGWKIVPATAGDVFTDDPMGLWDRLGPGGDAQRNTGLDTPWPRRYSSMTGPASSSRPPCSRPRRMAPSIT